MHWHKMPFGQFVLYEVRRYETWPFMVGMASVFAMGLFINSTVTEADKKASKYYQQFILGDRSGH